MSAMISGKEWFLEKTGAAPGYWAALGFTLILLAAAVL